MFGWAFGCGFYLQKPTAQPKGLAVIQSHSQKQLLSSTNYKAPGPPAFTGFWVKKITHLSLVMSILSHPISERNQMHLIYASGLNLHIYNMIDVITKYIKNNVQNSEPLTSCVLPLPSHLHITCDGKRDSFLLM